MRTLWSLTLLGIVATAAVAEDGSAFSYDDYAAVLKTYVDDRGMVDYEALKPNRAQLDAFIASMGSLSRNTYDGWSEDAKIAFWCNAYNAVTLERIINHYPIKPGGLISRVRFPNNSIRQIDGVWTDIKTPVMGEPITLDHMEHQIIRKEFNEPRIHMALVCAAMGCPKLRKEPFVGDRLDEQLTDQSRDFCNHPEKVRVAKSEDCLYLSSIFKWFGGDFEGKYTPDTGFNHLSGKERAAAYFVSLHVNDSDAEYLRTADYSIEYLDYDWSLNEQ